MNHKIKNPELLENGYIIVEFTIDKPILDLIKNKKWKNLDNYFLEISKTNGLLHNFLSTFVEFQKLEHIIAIRSAPEDEDGIWHDDGSRILGFSLSLNLSSTLIAGGELRFKKKEKREWITIKPLPIGQMAIFLSGLYGYEHMVSAVTKEERIVIAGWCS